MVRSRHRQKTTTNTVAKPRHRNIGFIGKGTLTEQEEASLHFIGRCIAALGHTLVIVPAQGTASAVRGGVESEGGVVHTIAAGVLHVADQTLLYPDTPLLEKLAQAFPDLETRPNVKIIEDLDGWVEAMKQLLSEYNITLT